LPSLSSTLQLCVPRRPPPPAGVLSFKHRSFLLGFQFFLYDGAFFFLPPTAAVVVLSFCFSLLRYSLKSLKPSVFFFSLVRGLLTAFLPSDGDVFPCLLVDGGCRSSSFYAPPSKCLPSSSLARASLLSTIDKYVLPSVINLRYPLAFRARGHLSLAKSALSSKDPVSPPSMAGHFSLT